MNTYEVENLLTEARPDLQARNVGILLFLILQIDGLGNAGQQVLDVVVIEDATSYFHRWLVWYWLNRDQPA